MKNSVRKLIPPPSIKSRNTNYTTSEDPATLLKSYMDIVESADKKLDKEQTDLYKHKVRALCSSYRLVTTSKKSNNQSGCAEKQFKLPLCQEKINQWSSTVKENLTQQEEALSKRIQNKRGVKTSSEPSKQLRKLQLQVKPENTMQSLEEAIKKLNGDKTKCIAELVETIAREKYKEIAKVEEKYAKEIATCKAPASLYKAIIGKLNDKKAQEVKVLNEKYAKQQANAINQAQSEYAQKLTNLYNEMKAKGRSPRHNSPKNGLVSQGQRKRAAAFEFPEAKVYNQEGKNN